MMATDVDLEHSDNCHGPKKRTAIKKKTLNVKWWLWFRMMPVLLYQLLPTLPVESRLSCEVNSFVLSQNVFKAVSRQLFKFLRTYTIRYSARSDIYLQSINQGLTRF